MIIKIAINGFGRVGRQVFKRIIQEHPKLKVVAVNDLTDQKTLEHLLKYDSNYGVWKDADVSGVTFLAEKNIENLPWKKLGIDIVLECTGLYTNNEDARKHIKSGAKKVILSAPGKDMPGFILGVNEETYDPKTVDMMEMGSCTTNCVATVAKVLNDNFKIIKGFMTTVHSYTNDQKILDLPHKDLRRARAAALNIIPTSTGAAKSLGKMIPELQGKLDGIALRVPTPVVSVLDLIVEIETPTTKEEVNSAFIKAEKNMKGILRTEANELVSMDFKGDSHSSIVDLSQTMVNGNMIKVLAWYDNEWGYSCRLAEFAEFVGKKL